MLKFDVVIIGGGPGGYVAAIRASQLGLKTALIEKDTLGGVCLNWGCIPTKSLIRNAEVVNLLSKGKEFGFEFDKASLKIDYGVAQQRSREVSSKLVKGINYLMGKNNISVFSGTAKLVSAYEVEVHPLGSIIEGRNIIIATGSRPRMITGVSYDEDKIMTSRGALELTELAAKMVVVGAGAIGMEFASIWNSYGVDVTVIEMKDEVLPLEDREVSAEMRKQFEKHGIKVMTGMKVERIQRKANAIKVTVKKNGKSETVDCDKILISVGIKPNTEELGLEKLKVEMDKEYIKVGNTMCTNVPSIYAIGDVTGKLALAHVASAQGIIAVEAIAGKKTQALEYYNMPRCTYCSPETASVGLTEEQAKQQGYNVKTGKFPFQVNGKALGQAETAGFAKVVADAKYGQILGVHMIGSHVTEMVAGPAGLISLEGTVEEMAKIVYPHPTLTEVIMEAAHDVEDNAIHI